MSGGVPHARSGEGYPIPCPGGYPIPGLGEGVPCPRSGGGVPRPRSVGGGSPSRPGWGVPQVSPCQTWDGVPPLARPGMGYPPWPDLGWGTPQPDLGWGTPRPYLGWGTPPARPGMGYPPPARPGMGYPPPPQMWTDTQTRVKTLPSLVLRTRAVISHDCFEWDYV